MTEIEIRNKLVNKAKSYLGAVRGSEAHKEILSIYNNHKPLARGYAMKQSDAWCACFASAMAIACELTDIIPTEVGCGEHIKLFQKLGRWQENDAYIPKAGDYIFYDWEDNGKGDNVGGADHVGIVEKVSNGVITVIEGNKGAKSEVGRRAIAVNGVCIRGFGIPDYASKAKKEPTVYTNIPMPTISKGASGHAVKVVQRLLHAMRYLGADGKVVEVDGEYGANSEYAVKSYQKRNGLTVNGVVDGAVWKKMLRGI